MYAVLVLRTKFMQRAGANIISSLTPVGDKPKVEDLIGPFFKNYF